MANTTMKVAKRNTLPNMAINATLPMLELFAAGASALVVNSLIAVLECRGSKCLRVVVKHSETQSTLRQTQYHVFMICTCITKETGGDHKASS